MLQGSTIARDEYLRRIAEAKSFSDLEKLELEVFGRKHGVLALALRTISKMPPAERKIQGAELNRLKEELASALARRKEELMEQDDKELENDALDLTVPLPESPRGHLHLIPEFIEEVKEVFSRMGFDVFEGPEIETEEINFTMLNIPPDHPARDMQSTFWVKTRPGEPKKVLRTHTSNAQIHYMLRNKPPFRVICPGRCYRRDADATHSPVFHQFEGLMIGEDVNLCHLKGVMVAAVKALLGEDVAFRFRASYFPFTEPSLEMDIMWAGKEGTEGKESKEGKERKEGGVPRGALRPGSAQAPRFTWLEVAGCGMVHPQVLRNVKIDPKKWQGFAFGFGVERLLMIRHNIPDIRLFYSNDLRFLEQF